MAKSPLALATATLTPSPWIAAAKPYTRGTLRQPVQGGVALLKLDSNEGLDPPDAVIERVVAFLRRPGAMNHYPDEDCRALRQALAAYVGCDAAQIVPACGADGALEAIARAFLAPGERAALVCPGYDQFRAFVEFTGAKADLIETGESVFRFDAGAFLDGCRSGPPPKLIYLISPNNPLGYAIGHDDIADIATAFPASVLVIDETYLEFEPHAASAARLLDQLPNLIVVRSFSKAFGLAGLRLGYLVAQPQVADTLDKLRNVKAVTALSQVAGLAVLENLEHFRLRMLQTRATRDWLVHELGAAGLKAHGGHANFILVECRNPSALTKALGQDGIRVRDLSWVRRLEGCVRISITNQRDMRRALHALLAAERAACDAGGAAE
jgi:histidinol-phosphate aminotransferase